MSIERTESVLIKNTNPCLSVKRLKKYSGTSEVGSCGLAGKKMDTVRDHGLQIGKK